MADILFKTPEGGLHAMLHGDLHYWSMGPLIALLVVYHLLATWTYGLSVSSGVFIHEHFLPRKRRDIEFVPSEVLGKRGAGGIANG